MFDRIQPQRPLGRERNLPGNILGGLGTVLTAASTGGESLRRQQEEERRRQELQQLGGILAGGQIPAFAREEFTPQQIQQTQAQQLASLGTPEAVRAIEQLVPTPERQLQQRRLQLQAAQAEQGLIEQRRRAGLEAKKQQLAEKKFSLDLKKFDRELETGGLSGEDQFKRATGLRKEFRDLSKDFIKQRDAFARVGASAEDPSAAGDLALIFNFMKVLDPGSTVREGEFANAQNSGGIPDRIRASYNRVREGERLSENIRNDFVDRSKKIFNSANKQHSKRIGEFTTLAQKSNVPADQVIIDLGLAEQESAQESAAERVPTGASIFQQGVPQQPAFPGQAPQQPILPQSLPQSLPVQALQQGPISGRPTSQEALTALRNRGRI